MPVIQHAKSITYADCTDTNKLRPTDWNSSHNQFWTLQGNTSGASTLSGTNIQLSGGNNITLSVNGQTIGISAGAGGGGIALSASNNLYSSGTVVISGGANVTVGTNGQTITISAAGGGAGIAGISVSTATLHTSGTVTLLGVPGFKGTEYQNVAIQATNGSLFWVARPDFVNEGYFAFGKYTTTMAYPPYLEAYHYAGGDYSVFDLEFNITGGQEFQYARFEAISTSQSQTVAYWMHLPRIGVSTQGNTGGTTGLVSGARQSIVLVGSNNITLSQSSDTGGATVSVIGGAGGGGVAVSANQLATSGTVVFSNSNNFTFGMSNSSVVTLTYDREHHTGSHVFQVGRTDYAGPEFINVWISDTNFALVFSQSGTHAAPQARFISPQRTDGQGTVAYYENLPNMGVSTQGNTGGTTGLVTGANQSLLLVGSNNITLSQSSNASGATVSIFGGAGAAGNTGYLSAGTTYASLGTISLSNLNGVSFGINGQTLTASVAGGGGVALSAGTTQATSGTVVFSNSNSVSFGMNGNTVTASIAPADTYLTITQGANISLSSSQNGSSVTLTISATSLLSLAASNSTYASGTVVLTGSNNITVSYNGQTVQISGPNTHAQQTGISGISVPNTAYTSGTVVFTGTNGITVTSSGAGQTVIISGSVAPAAIVASNSTLASGSVVVTGSNNVTVSYNGQTIQISGANTHAQQTGISGIAGSGASTVTNGTVQFSNLNNVSFGLNGSTMTASVPAGVTATGNLGGIVASNTTITSGSVVLSASTNITISYNGQSVLFSCAAPGAGAAGTNTFSVDGLSSITGSAVQVVFSAGPNVTLQQTTNGSSMTLGVSVAAPGGGAGYTKSIKVLGEDFVGFQTGSECSSHNVGSTWFMPVHMDSPISISNLFVVKSLNMSLSTSSNSSGRQSLSYTHQWWLFRRSDFAANSLSLTYQTSGSFGLSLSRSHTSNNNSVTLAWVTNSTGGTSTWSSASAGVGLSSYWTGQRFFALPMVTSLSQGEWFLAQRHSSSISTSGANWLTFGISNKHWSLQSGNTVLAMAGTSGASRFNPFQMIGFGRATTLTTNAAMAASVISADSLQYWHGIMANVGVIA